MCLVCFFFFIFKSFFKKAFSVQKRDKVIFIRPGVSKMRRFKWKLLFFNSTGSLLNQMHQGEMYTFHFFILFWYEVCLCAGSITWKIRLMALLTWSCDFWPLNYTYVKWPGWWHYLLSHFSRPTFGSRFRLTIGGDVGFARDGGLYILSSINHACKRSSKNGF